MRRRPARERKQRVEQVLELTGVSELSPRYPRHLSGGEKQRVALARALAVEPQVLLLDEPVSAIDEQSRDSLCRELKRLHQTVGTTTVHVCHNFREMLTVADRVAVISEGRVRQVGTPQEVMEQPASRFVAGFVQAENVMSARASREGPLTRLRREDGFACLFAAEAEGDVHFVIRPENICVHRRREDVEPEAINVVAGRVTDLLDLGAAVHLTVETEHGLALAVSLGKSRQRELRTAVGDAVFLAFPAEVVHVVQD
jgi:molybdate transport system ATP-binding protein/molybdate/tungstate transport system ATP-binding protein